MLRSIGSARAVVLVSLVLFGCRHGAGCGAPALAELVNAQGDVTRDYRAHEQHWEAAESGARFAIGDGLRTGKAASAELRVGEAGRVLVQAETIIRFLTPPKAADAAVPGLEVTQGAATLESRATDLQIRTPDGSALLRAGSRVVLQPSREGQRYRVTMGSATFAQADGQTLTVTQGHDLSIGIGLAVLDDAAHQASAGAHAAPSSLGSASAGGPTASGDAGQASSSADLAHGTGADELALLHSQALQHEVPSVGGPADMTVPAGESFRVYDPQPPTTIGFALADHCAGDGELSVDDHAAIRGKSSIEVRAPVGHHTYLVRCSAATGRGVWSARGWFRVTRGDGARPLPKTAPHDSIDLDGHKYRLMYQNLRPIVTARWPSAPPAAAYVLTVQSPGLGARLFRSRTAEYVLAADALGDGEHVLRMQAEHHAATSSRDTTVDVEFDNASPAVSVELPPAQGFVSGAAVQVRGTAVEGSLVSLEGEAIPLDRRHIFARTLTLPADKRALAIRIQHPAHGVRYFLRRALNAH